MDLNDEGKKILLYQKTNGRVPFREWMESIHSDQVTIKIDRRVTRLQAGNFGDVKPVGHGVHELRIHAGKGYRVYFANDGAAVIILLCGGEKNSQEEDIKKAKLFWHDYQKRKKPHAY